jgi:hypothetical protein
MFGNRPSWMRRHVSGSTHADGKIGSLLNKDYSLVTNAREDSLIEAPTPNIFSSNSSSTTSIVAITVDALMAVGFNHQSRPSKE